MIYLLYGDNQSASRHCLQEYLSLAKLNHEEIIHLNGSKLILTELIQALESGSMFNDQRTVVLENLFSRPSSKEKEKLIHYLKVGNFSAKAIIWEKKAIPGTTTRWLPKNWILKSFKTPVIIFSFLESIKPGNASASLQLLHKCLISEEAELVFYLLCRGIRNLILAKSGGREALSGSPWQVSKIIHQSTCFTLDKLLYIFHSLLEIDCDIKTGRSPMPLSWHLDLLISNI